MFKYINMPTLVAMYLREFCTRTDGTTSYLYKFIFCLCLPFVSKTFDRARMNALAIAECTNSADQIARVLNKLTGASVTYEEIDIDFYIPYDATDDTPSLPYDNSLGQDNPIVLYSPTPNELRLNIALGSAKRSEVEAYLPLLLPFYIKYTITYI